MREEKVKEEGKEVVLENGGEVVTERLWSWSSQMTLDRREVPPEKAGNEITGFWQRNTPQ